ncbi:MAG: ATP-binding cassette domain-containing protein, partial [Nitrospira sp.]
MGETKMTGLRNEMQQHYGSSIHSSSTQSSVLGPQPLDTIINVSGFVKRYRKHVAVKGVDIRIRKGEIYGLIGPDGAGKSSLMKAIAGVLTYDEGTVEVFGTLVDSEREAERVKERIGFLPQGLGLNLYPDLS